MKTRRDRLRRSRPADNRARGAATLSCIAPEHLQAVRAALNLFVNIEIRESFRSMPLSHAESRQLLHLRDIAIRGYLRADGLVDIEAHMKDTKTYSFGNHDRGRINAGEALHGMGLRLTLDDKLTVVRAEAAMDDTPHAICPGVAPNFAALAGLTIGKGFLKGAMERVGGTAGCTHLRELLQQVATTAIQTMFSIRAHKSAREGGTTEDRWDIPSALLNSCHAYNEQGPLVAKVRARAEERRREAEAAAE